MVSELLGWVRLPSPLLSIDLAYGGGGDYRVVEHVGVLLRWGVEREFLVRVALRSAEYHGCFCCKNRRNSCS